jgi:hypothetical protein
VAILRDNWTVIAIAVAVIAALALLIWLWWWLPKWQMRSVTAADPKARADIEDNFRKTVGQALGGAAVLIGAGFGLFQFLQQQKTTSEQQRISAGQFAEQQKAASDQALAQQRAAQDLLISNQVAKGFEQLAGKETLMRLGGIYGLEGVMNTSEQYHQSVLEALCAFVRDGTIGMIVGKHPTTDIQAALTVIGRRAAREGDRVDLSAARIAGANLSSAGLSGANLFFADLRGANLSSADLTSADLSDANLSDVKDLSQAQLDKACGTDAKLPPGLTLKPCPKKPVAPPLNPGTTP